MSSPSEQPTTSFQSSPQTPSQSLRLAHIHELVAKSGMSSPRQSPTSSTGSKSRPSWKSTMLSPSPSPCASPSPISEPHVLARPSDGRVNSIDPLSSSPSPTLIVHAHTDKLQGLPRLARQCWDKATATNPPPFGAVFNTALPLSRSHQHQHLHLHPHPAPPVRSIQSPAPPPDHLHEHDSIVQGKIATTSTEDGESASGYQSPPVLRLDTTSSIRQLGVHGVVRERSNSAECQHHRATPAEDEPSTDRFMLRSPPAPRSRVPAVYRAQGGTEYYPTPVSVIERPRWSTSFPIPNGQCEVHAHAHEHGRDGREADPSRGACDARYRLAAEYAPPPTMTRPRYTPQAGQPHGSYGMMRPRLHIHPYASPAVHASDSRYYSAGALPPRQTLPMVERAFSPASAISPGSFKAPRKRADDAQLSVLNEVFARTSYPSTEEREDLARRLGMTSRSVQIWFQNRRRAVKVEQQSAAQRAEAEARGRIALAPPRFQEPINPAQASLAGLPTPESRGGMAQMPQLPMPHGQYRQMSHDELIDRPSAERVVKREMESPERGR